MRRGYPTRPVTPTVSMSSRGRWLTPDAVGPVGFRALQCLLPWLAMVAFGCGVAPMRPAPICEQCIRTDRPRPECTVAAVVLTVGSDSLLPPRYKSLTAAP